MSDSKSNIVYVRLTQAQREALDELVRQTQIGTISDYIRKAVDEYLLRHTSPQPSATD